MFLTYYILCSCYFYQCTDLDYEQRHELNPFLTNCFSLTNDITVFLWYKIWPFPLTNKMSLLFWQTRCPFYFDKQDVPFILTNKMSHLFWQTICMTLFLQQTRWPFEFNYIHGYRLIVDFFVWCTIYPCSMVHIYVWSRYILSVIYSDTILKLILEQKRYR